MSLMVLKITNDEIGILSDSLISSDSGRKIEGFTSKVKELHNCIISGVGCYNQIQSIFDYYDNYSNYSYEEVINTLEKYIESTVNKIPIEVTYTIYVSGKNCDTNNMEVTGISVKNRQITKKIFTESLLVKPDYVLTDDFKKYITTDDTDNLIDNLNKAGYIAKQIDDMMCIRGCGVGIGGDLKLTIIDKSNYILSDIIGHLNGCGYVIY